MQKDTRQKNSPLNPKLPNRLYSLDALRGFDMFWIIGGGSIIISLGKIPGLEWLEGLAKQMEHVPWEGFRFWDLIFPLFMFISGVAVPIAVQSKKLKGITNKTLWLKALKRMILLIILGWLYNGVFQSGFENARYVSVLGQIGIAYFFTFLIFIYSHSLKSRLIVLVSILLGIAFLQLFFPVPDIGAGKLTPEGCINGYIDRLLLPGRLAYGPEGMISGNGIYDALGILSIVSATGITLMGTVLGNILQMENLSEYKKIAVLTTIGLTLIAFALFLSPFYPIIKNCWTSSYSLLAGGVSFLLMTFFYLVIDVWKLRKWAFFFVVIGMNSLFIYLVTALLPAERIVQSFIGFLIQLANDTNQVIMIFGELTFFWLLLYFMYQRNIFIRV